MNIIDNFLNIRRSKNNINYWVVGNKITNIPLKYIKRIFSIKKIMDNRYPHSCIENMVNKSRPQDHKINSITVDNNTMVKILSMLRVFNLHEWNDIKNVDIGTIMEITGTRKYVLHHFRDNIYNVTLHGLFNIHHYTLNINNGVIKMITKEKGNILNKSIGRYLNYVLSGRRITGIDFETHTNNKL